MTKNEFRGGFSFRDKVVGKPPQEDLYGLQLGNQWVWADGAQPDHLLNCLTVRGFAVTPGRWADGHKSKKTGTMSEASYMLLDYDSGLSWADAKTNEFFNAFALFAYTSASHGKPGKGDRFRIVFALNKVIHDPETFDKVLYGLRHFSPDGDDPAINAAGLLFGNPSAEVHVYGMDNRLDVESCYMQAALMEAQRKFSREAALQAADLRHYEEDNSIRRVRRWLSLIPNTARTTWVKVAGCMRNIEGQGFDWAFPLFEEWSARDYADFDPDECERLWESLEPGMGGFNALKGVSAYFEKYPYDEEVDQRKLNNQRFNNAITTYRNNEYR